jgi:hypothetical protein
MGVARQLDGAEVFGQRSLETICNLSYKLRSHSGLFYEDVDDTVANFSEDGRCFGSYRKN